MCQLEFEDAGREPSIIVASVTQLSVDRKCPVWRDIVAYQKLRRERLVESGREIERPMVSGTVAPVHADGLRRGQEWRSGK